VCETEAAAIDATPASDADARSIAAELVRRGRSGSEIRTRGPDGALGGRRIPASLLEHRLEALLRAGWIGLVWRLRGSGRTLIRVKLRDREALEEFAYPGRRAARRAALAEARAAVASLSHPVGKEVGRLLGEEGSHSWRPRLVKALAAVALHAETGDVLASRVFAARYLGDSKALGAVRPRLEKLLGPLDALGIRDGAVATFVGGAGRLRAGRVTLELARLGPFVGLARDTLVGDIELDAPPGGVLLVENFAAFEACCRGEVLDTKEAFVVWTAGYPGRGVHRLVEAATRRAVRLRIWADLDLDGVRIARLVASWVAHDVDPFRMSPDDLAATSAHRPLTARSAAAIRADLDERPTAFLADTLRALLASGCWVEQEAFLG
jgi:hypothetical protein